MGPIHERYWSVERNGQTVPVAVQHLVPVGRFDVTVGGFAVPVSMSATPDGATILSFLVRGQHANIVVSNQAGTLTYDLELGPESAASEPTPGPVARKPPAPSQPSVPVHQGPPAGSSSMSHLKAVAAVLVFVVLPGLGSAVGTGASQKLFAALFTKKITWAPLESKEGRFNVDMPDSVKGETKSIQTAAGAITLHVWTADVRSRGFSAGYIDMPSDVSVDRQNAVLTGARDGSVREVKGGKLVDSRFTTFLGYPGVEYEATVDGGETHQRVFLVRNRMYHLVMAGSVPLNREEEEHFFSSFRLTDI